jgi:predicted AlkP superfamily phosphohydrolase/phosphomutase
MNALNLKRGIVITVGVIFLVISLLVIARQRVSVGQSRPWKLYWFVPDGLRADPDHFQLFKWAREGKLPNIKRMMEQGSYGYSIPVFPSHTPVNFATLFTGVMPLRHGVADGPIRIPGYPLKIVPRTGFSSVAKTIDPFWFTLEQAGWIVSLLSVPGSTPPELTRGAVIKGRWGGWGIEFPSLSFHSVLDTSFREALGWNDKVFQIGKKLTEFVEPVAAGAWPSQVAKSFSPLVEVNLRAWEADLFALLVDSTDDGVENYDQAVFATDRAHPLFTLKEGEWSDWFDLKLVYRLQQNYQMDMPQRLNIEQDMSSLAFATQSRVKVEKLGDKKSLRFRVLYDALNDSVAVPHNMSEDLHQAAGPMVDFVDNFPPQLIYFDEDKKTFLEEAEMSFAWHKAAEEFFLQQSHQDVLIQSIYSPNQMLTSRWWMGAMDPRAKKYASYSEKERSELQGEVLNMYKKIDDMIGAALDQRGSQSFVVLSSDHGAVPLNFEVRLNNYFASKGWLKYSLDPETRTLRIDWPKTKVVFLNMNHVFIHPRGLGGDYRPASGPEYERLRAEVQAALEQLQNENGEKPLAAVHTREQAQEWGLPEDRVGDLIIANRAGYGWIEDVTSDQKVFVESLKAGYKQGILPGDEKGLWTPFIIVGPGVKKNYEIQRPISHIEQYPTVMKLLNVKPPYEPDGKPLSEIFE